MKSEIALVRADLREMEQRVIIRIGGLLMVVAGLLFGALDYWPPH